MGPTATNPVAAVPIPLGFLDGSLGPEEDIAGGEAELAENLSMEGAKGGSGPKAQGQSPESKGLQARCSRMPTEPAVAAAASGDYERLRAALKDGWNPDKTCSGATALHWAAGSGHQECCAVLLEEFSANIDYSGRSGRTALHWAARNGHTKLCRWLVSKGADPRKVTHDGVNLFHWAVFGQHLETAAWCIEAGADPHACNRWGCSAIHWAASTGSLSLCRWLASEVGLDFGLRNNQGHDGLMKAAWNGARELCEHLLSLPGGQESLVGVDRAGMGVSEMARVNGHPELADWLQAKEDKARGSSAQAGGSQGSRQKGMTNAAFVVYYRNQALVSKEHWAAFHDALQQPTPVTLRLSGQHASRVAAVLMDQFPEVERLQVPQIAGSSIILQIGNTEWKRTATLRQQCEKAARGGFLSFPDMEELIQARLLEIEPSNTVLDMCAGNCSRAVCCLEDMSALAGAQYPDNGCLPDPQKLTGVMVANGENAKHFVEASSLLRRGSVPMLATVSNPVKFPCLFAADGTQELFDRVVCTPPCTNDGLLRNKAHLWHNWTMQAPFAHHIRQVKLLLRGLHLLAPGGRLLYSARSFNPIEGEAVIAATLRRYKGAVQLMDAMPLLESLGAAPGLTEWKVPDPEGVSLFRYYSRWTDVPAALRPPKGTLRETMFPDPELAGELRKCGRLMPADADGVSTSWGGCFIALFRKESHRAAHAEDWNTTRPPELNGQTPSGGVARPPRFARTYHEVSLDLLSVLEKFYGLDPALFSAPSAVALDVTSRDRQGEPRSICLMSQGAANAAIRHSSSLQASKVQCAGAGMPIFSRLDLKFLQNVECRWRPTRRAAAWFARHATRRVARTDREGLISILTARILELRPTGSGAEYGSAVAAVLAEPTCLSPGGHVEPGGLVIGCVATDVWIPALLTHTELKIAVDKESALMLIQILHHCQD